MDKEQKIILLKAMYNTTEIYEKYLEIVTKLNELQAQLPKTETEIRDENQVAFW